jgi:hypothetical protein
MAMSVVMIASVLWIVLAVAFAVILGRTVRLADRRERRGTGFPPAELVPEDPPSRSDEARRPGAPPSCE